MSAGNEQALTARSGMDELTDEQVRDYLRAHDDFLQRHPDLLDFLRISHASGSAISLVERQVSILRERNMDMRHRLSTLTNHARENDRLYDKTRALVLKLLESTSIDALCRSYSAAMADEFAVESACIILFDDGSPAVAFRTESRERVTDIIGALTRSNKPVCGAIRQEEAQFLFPQGGAVKSAAVVPLGLDEQIGVIAVGSADANRYNSAVGTLFLAHIGEVISRLLPRLGTAAG